nr:hypothetical protein [Tanacetum cinerariifolium]
MANVPLNDPNVDASAIVPAPVNPDHAPAQPVENLEEEKEDPEEDPEEDDDVMEIDDEAEVIDPYMDDGSNNPPDPNVDASAIVPAPVNPDHAPAQPVEEEEDTKEEEENLEEEKEDPEEDPEEDDDFMEIDDEAEVIDPYMDDGSNNPPPPNSEDEETPPTSLVIPMVMIVPTGPMCPNLGTAWKRLGKMEKLMSERIDTEGRVKKKFKEQDRHFVGIGCDNIEMDRTVRNVMLDLSGLKKLVKGLSDQFDEYKGRKVFKDKRARTCGTRRWPLWE